MGYGIASIVIGVIAFFFAMKFTADKEGGNAAMISIIGSLLITLGTVVVNGESALNAKYELASAQCVSGVMSQSGWAEMSPSMLAQQAEANTTSVGLTGEERSVVVERCYRTVVDGARG